MNRSLVLGIIVFSQFAGVSLWFLPNAFLTQLVAESSAGKASVSLITSLVQFGFIAGTFCFAFLSLADRFSPSKLFFFSTVLAAGCNVLLLCFEVNDFAFYVLRFLIGFFLAGIYPVGMKIAADHFDTAISKALGLLVGALVLGTALPHLLAGMSYSMSWSKVIWLTSLLALIGGLSVSLFIPDGPNRKPGQVFHPEVIISVFKNKPFRRAALGYFGHMWELYAFWAFVPVMISLHADEWFDGRQQASLFSFVVIAVGSIACVVGGMFTASLRHRVTSYQVAWYALLISGLCCLLSPIVFQQSMVIQVIFLVVWGMAVIADSPQFSSMVGANAPPVQRGSAITMVTCIGFGITIISITLMGWIIPAIGIEWSFLLLVPGPVLGLIGMKL